MLKSKKRFKRTVGELLFDLFKVLFILFISIVCIYPFWNIFVISVNDGQDALRGGLYFWPRMFTLENYEQIFQRKEFLDPSVYFHHVFQRRNGSLLSAAEKPGTA